MAKQKKAQKEGEEGRTKVRTSYAVYSDTQQKIRVMSALTGENIEDIVDKALQAAVAQYEKNHGPIPIK